MPQPEDFLGHGTNDSTVATRAARDAYNAVREACNLSHFGTLAEIITGLGRGTAGWAGATMDLGLTFNSGTTFLNGLHLDSGKWGQITPPAPAISRRIYATHIRSQFPLVCNEGQQYPFGYSAVTPFAGSSEVGNPPPPGTPRLAPRQSVTLSAGSSALLSVESVAPKVLDLQGGISVSLSDCTDQSCTATLSRLQLSVAPFTIEGFNVTSLQIISSGDNLGVMQGDTVAFPSTQATAYVQLADGRYDNLTLTGGTVLARWEPELDRFALAFAFETVVEGTNVLLSGSAFGTFFNTSPIASIDVVSPPVQSVDDEVQVECASPTGTTIELKGVGTDIQNEDLTYQWFDGVTKLHDGAALTLANLPIGSTTSVQLMAYDARGSGGNARLTVNVADTTAPTILTNDICIFPPNHRTVCLQVGEELRASSTDACVGDTSSSLHISNVSSSSGTGVASWTGSEACVVVERAGSEGDRVYSITLTGSDGNGHSSSKDLAVVVPHNGPAHDCLKTQEIQ